MSKKLTYEFVKEQFEKEGYVLVSKKYINIYDKLEFVCPNGHKHLIRWNDWQQGHRCKDCSIENSIKSKRIGLHKVRISFESEGYILLSSIYKNAHTKLEYICPKGHKHSISWIGWQHSRRRCPYCAGQGKPTIDYIKHEFEKEDYNLLSKKYNNNRTKLNYICSKGHRHSITWSDWKSGYRCPYCNGRPIVTTSIVREAMTKEGYILVSEEYKNSKSKLNYKCTLGHFHSITWNDWTNGYRCPTCAIIKMSGPGHPNWHGGISYEPYCPIWKDTEFKEDIKARDGFKCLNPACNSKNSNDLTIHHIDYNKKNCSPSNLITVCRSCNSKANSDRKWHTAWYSTIIKNRYGLIGV